MFALAVILGLLAVLCAGGAHLRVNHGAALKSSWASLELAVALFALAWVLAALFSGHWVWHVS